MPRDPSGADTIEKVWPVEVTSWGAWKIFIEKCDDELGEFLRRKGWEVPTNNLGSAYFPYSKMEALFKRAKEEWGDRKLPPGVTETWEAWVASQE